MDLHVEGQAGAARRVVGGAAVVAAVGRAQGLQLEESALLGELGVSIRLERPPAPGGRPSSVRGWPCPAPWAVPAPRCKTALPCRTHDSMGPWLLSAGPTQ